MRNYRIMQYCYLYVSSNTNFVGTLTLKDECLSIYLITEYEDTLLVAQIIYQLGCILTLKKNTSIY